MHVLGRRAGLAWLTYAVLACYAAINIPVVSVLSTPLTARCGARREARSRTPSGSTRPPRTSSLSWQWQRRHALAPLLSAACVTRAGRRAARGLCRRGPGGVRASRRVGSNATRGPRLPLVMPQVTARTAAADWRDAASTARRRRPVRASAARPRDATSCSSASSRRRRRYLGLYGAAPDVDAAPLRAGPHERSCSTTRTRCTPKASKGCSRCCARPTRRSTAAAGDVRGRAVPVDRDGARRRGYATGAVPLRAVHVSGHGGRRPQPRLRRCSRTRATSAATTQSSFGVDEPSTVARILGGSTDVPQDRPFFVTYLPIAGHHPYDTPEPGPFPERDEFGRYRNALHYGDAALGALIDGLEAPRPSSRTRCGSCLGDHGEAFGQHEGNYGHTFHCTTRTSACRFSSPRRA